MAIPNSKANPNQKQIGDRNANQNARPVQTIDLSSPQYYSDGKVWKPDGLLASSWSLEPVIPSLHLLTEAFNKRDPDAPKVNFVNAFPTGYVVWGRQRTHYPTIRDIYIWGHPSGRPFHSMNSFSTHVVSIMQNDLDNCACPVCSTAPPPRPPASAISAPPAPPAPPTPPAPHGPSLSLI